MTASKKISLQRLSDRLVFGIERKHATRVPLRQQRSPSTRELRYGRPTMICRQSLFILLCGILSCAYGQTDWPSYGHDPGVMRHSPLTQINTKNVARLKEAWVFHASEGLSRSGSEAHERGPDAQTVASESVPLVIDGVMYLSTGYGTVVALQPETGKVLWTWQSSLGMPPLRGISYWPGDKQHPPQLMFATGRGYLVALNVKTGKLVPGFGNEGAVDLKAGVSQGYPKSFYLVTSPGAVYKNLVIQGDRFSGGNDGKGPYNDIRAWDTRTGAPAWTFHTVPRPGEPGNETWEGNSWKDRIGVSVWGLMSVDAERGIVYAPTEAPTYDYYGGDRKGMNLYSDCLLALDANTGKLLWYFQTTHHDIFDYDLSAPPALIDVVQNGKKIPAVAQVTKMGLLFIFDRVTGKPIFGVEERPVPKSDVPGEQAWPTQPFPLKPPPLARNSFKLDEIAKVTPEHQKYCEELLAADGGLSGGGPYTPLGLKETIMFPGAAGSANYGGVSFDPQLGYIFVNEQDLSALGKMSPAAPGSAIPYIKRSIPGQSGKSRFFDPTKTMPCQQPPWGQLHAINANTGDIVWTVPLGVFDELEANGVPKTGAPNLGGSITTAGGLVFIAATNDNRFRAFSSRTGEELWVTKLPAGGHGHPVTYQGRNGKQYVVITAGGNLSIAPTPHDTVVAFALP
jgi:quinoprotein glucose dehydrogenase